MPLLSYDHVDIAYNGATAIHNVCFAIDKGEILGIVGESGSGKSTLLKAAMGLLGPDGMVAQGDIRYSGKSVPEGDGCPASSPDISLVDIPEKRLRALCGPELGMVFQDCLAALTPIRHIGDQVYESLAAHGSLSRAEADARMVGLLRHLNFEEPERVLGCYPFELSGGMGQRVGIAMAMLQTPKVLLADEPTSALDVVSQRQVIDELSRLREDCDTAIVLVAHNIGVIRILADKVVVLEDGIVRESGPTAQVLHDPSCAYTRELLAATPRLKVASV